MSDLTINLAAICTPANYNTRLLICVRFFGRDSSGPESLDLRSAPAQYSLFILTIPWLTQRLPAVLLPALKHHSVLLPCFQTLLVLGYKFLSEMSKMDHMKNQQPSGVIPLTGWALANVICLAAGNTNDFVDHGGSNQDLYYTLYIRVVIILSEDLLSKLHVADLSSGLAGKAEKEYEMILKRTLQSICILSINPNTTTSVIIQLLVCAINAACAAVEDAGIPMKYLAVAICCCLADGGSVILNPTKLEERVGV